MAFYWHSGVDRFLLTTVELELAIDDLVLTDDVLITFNGVDRTWTAQTITGLWNPNDTTTRLNEGTGGDTLDESSISVTSLDTGSVTVVGNRDRLVFGGEHGRDVVAEPVAAVPIVDEELRATLRPLLESRRRRVELLEAVMLRAVGHV